MTYCGTIEVQGHTFNVYTALSEPGIVPGTISTWQISIKAMTYCWVASSLHFVVRSPSSPLQGAIGSKSLLHLW